MGRSWPSYRGRLDQGCLCRPHNSIDQGRKEDNNIKLLQPKREGGVNPSLVRSFFEYAESVGLDPAVLFEPMLVAAVRESNAKVPIAACQMIMEHLMAETHDPDFALKIAEFVKIRHYGIVGFAALSSKTLNDAITLMLRFYPLITESNTAKRVECGDLIELHWLPYLGPGTSLSKQHSMASWAVMARQLTARPDLTGAAYFSFKQPDRIDAYQRIFGPELYFDQPETKLVFGRWIAELPIAQSDPPTHNLLMAQVEKAFQALSQSTLLQNIVAYITAHLASNSTGIHQVAAALGMSSRTLQYQLSADGYAYRDLLERIRQEHAEHYLKHTDMSLNDIAYALGYSEQSPFQKAFKRWTGQAPGEYRKQAGEQSE